MRGSPRLTMEFVGWVQQEALNERFDSIDVVVVPSLWPEPFGLVMIEAMAAGTPVIAWPCGSTSEVIEPGRSGFLVETIDEAVAADDAAGFDQPGGSELRPGLRGVGDPPGIDEAFQHAGDGRGLHAERGGDVHGHHAALAAALTVAGISREEFAPLSEALGVDIAISPRLLAAGAILGPWAGAVSGALIGTGALPRRPGQRRDGARHGDPDRRASIGTRPGRA